MRRFVRDIHGRFVEVRSEVPELPVGSSRGPKFRELLKHEQARIAFYNMVNGEMPAKAPTENECIALAMMLKATGELPFVDLTPAAEEKEESRILSEDECRQRIEKMRAEGRLPTFEEFHPVVEDVLDEMDAEGGNEPRERIFPRKVKRIQ